MAGIHDDDDDDELVGLYLLTIYKLKNLSY